MLITAWLGPGVPVDVEGLVSLVTGPVDWVSDRELHGCSVSVEELLVKELGGSWFDRATGCSVAFEGAGDLSFTLRCGTGVSESLLSISCGDMALDDARLDRLAKCSYFMAAMSNNKRMGYRSHYRTTLAFRSGQEPGGLPGVGEMQWFGEPLVSWLGGEAAFESLPEGWAERVGSSHWRVAGIDLAEDPAGFAIERRSTREEAVVQFLGSEFFFDPDTKFIPSVTVPLPASAPFAVYRWEDGLTIQQPDGSTELVPCESLNMGDQQTALADASQFVELASLFESELEDLGLADLVADDPLEWVDEWLRGQSIFDLRAATMMVGGWLGQHLISTVPSVKWEQASGAWKLRAGGSLFDPFEVVDALMSGRAGMSIGLFAAAVRGAASSGS